MAKELSFREYLIGQAIAGIAGSPTGIPQAATKAIRLADEIIEQLAVDSGEKEPARPVRVRPR